MKCTKPIHQKWKGHSTTVFVIPSPNTLIVHMPVDLQPIKDLFNPDAPDDMVSTSANGHHYSASEDLNFQLDTILQPPTPVLCPPMGAQKGSAHVLGKCGAVPLESGPTKQVRRGTGLQYSDTDILLSGTSPELAPSTLLGPLPPATQLMVSVPQLCRLVLTNYATSAGDIHQCNCI